MHNSHKTLIKNAMDFINSFYEKYGDPFIFRSYAFIVENIEYCKEVAKAVGLEKEKYEYGLLAIAFKDVGLLETDRDELANHLIVKQFIDQSELGEENAELFYYYLNFLRNPGSPKNKTEQVLLDGMDIHLALPDTLERINLLRSEMEIVQHKIFMDLDWLEIVKTHFHTHNYFTQYAKSKYGTQRSKNYTELERRIEKVKFENSKLVKANYEGDNNHLLSFKDSEGLFKFAFRNYVSLVSVADRKASLLIHVNSIIASITIAFTIRHLEDRPLFILPVTSILIVALITILFAILASRPQEHIQHYYEVAGNENFFFGSFDRLDDSFVNISWDNYNKSTGNIINGTKTEVLTQIIQETFIVRKVLAKKFRFITIANRVFIYGLFVSIICFLIVYLIYK